MRRAPSTAVRTRRRAVRRGRRVRRRRRRASARGGSPYADGPVPNIPPPGPGGGGTTCVAALLAARLARGSAPEMTRVCPPPAPRRRRRRRDRRDRRRRVRSPLPLPSAPSPRSPVATDSPDPPPSVAPAVPARGSARRVPARVRASSSALGAAALARRSVRTLPVASIADPPAVCANDKNKTRARSSHRQSPRLVVVVVERDRSIEIDRHRISAIFARLARVFLARFSRSTEQRNARARVGRRSRRASSLASRARTVPMTRGDVRAAAAPRGHTATRARAVSVDAGKRRARTRGSRSWTRESSCGRCARSDRGRRRIIDWGRRGRIDARGRRRRRRRPRRRGE